MMLTVSGGRPTGKSNNTQHAETETTKIKHISRLQAAIYMVIQKGRSLKVSDNNKDLNSSWAFFKETEVRMSRWDVHHFSGRLCNARWKWTNACDFTDRSTKSHYYMQRAYKRKTLHGGNKAADQLWTAVIFKNRHDSAVENHRVSSEAILKAIVNERGPQVQVKTFLGAKRKPRKEKNKTWTHVCSKAYFWRSESKNIKRPRGVVHPK